MSSRRSIASTLRALAEDRPANPAITVGGVTLKVESESTTRVRIDEFAGEDSLDNTILTDYYRFRTYETIVPMRNAIWNTGT